MNYGRHDGGGYRYAVADLHGRIDLYNQIKLYVNDNDTIYVLGDAGDRGPAPWLTLKTVLDDPQCVYIMGNHDMMLWKAIECWIENHDEDGRGLYMFESEFQDLVYNGGLNTFKGWLEEPNRMDYYLKLKALPLSIVLHSLNKDKYIHLSHAGYTPRRAFYESTEDFVWDRQHFCDNWSSPRHLVIHGHTYVYIVKNYLDDCITYKLSYDLSNGYLTYSNGSKVCIDLHSIASNKTCLYDIDNEWGHIIEVESEVGFD